MKKSDKGFSEKVLASYRINADGLFVDITIKQSSDFLPLYHVTIPGIAEGTRLLLESQLKSDLIREVKLDISEILDMKKAPIVKRKFQEVANRLIKNKFPSLGDEQRGVLVAYLIQNTLGLGRLENLLYDDDLEEIAVNGAGENVLVYHKKFGWCKTNIKMKSDEQIQDYASMISRRVGRQINVLNPLLDAHLPTGERVNATLYPISNTGSTITIRKFSKNPWTMPILIKTKTISSSLAALIWTLVQNEISLLVSGGTGSGKTSFLNALSGFIPVSHRIISIEDTRELTLPSFLQWVPLVTREPNSEGKGEVTMLDLLVNSLRMRPDRILVGEVRRQREAEILFEAMHTGHSVYATLHADNVEQTISRLVNPPINIHEEMLNALGGVVVQFRHRRLNIRRTLEFAEINKDNTATVTHKWDVKSDKIKQISELNRLYETLNLYTGMSIKEIDQDIDEKAVVLDWMVKNKYFEVDVVGKIVSHYYRDPEEIVNLALKGKSFDL